MHAKPLAWATALLCFSVFVYFWDLGGVPFYMDADQFNPWWDQDAKRLAGVIQKIGKVESSQ